ncbi:MAG: hypothetical protein KGJ52_05305 [Gammaproteobacteria bacterium]|nr:hypothetical protein [Gammaproteobacteria bacterium]
MLGWRDGLSNGTTLKDFKVSDPNRSAAAHATSRRRRRRGLRGRGAVVRSVFLCPAVGECRHIARIFRRRSTVGQGACATGVEIMKAFLLSITTLLVLAACGGGSMPSSTVQPAMQGVATSGTITAFGSVYVNGVRYDVSAATIRKNDRSVMQSALAVGEVALVRGHQSAQTGQGTADSVEVEDNVVGPIATIDVAGGKLTVLGQTVLVTANTSFDMGITPADLTGLMTGDAVEISGFADANGVITATRIGRAEAGEPLQVLGTVAGFDAANHVFMINGLKVDFTAASVSGFTAGAPANGDLVVVRGTAFDATTTTLTATEVLRAHTDPRESGDGQHSETGVVELEGLIMNFASATDFEVDGAKVTTTTSTVYKGGTAADLANNVRVEVRGSLDANKVLVADEIDIHRIAAIELESTASSVDAANHTLQLLGVTVTVDAHTRFEDKSSAHVQMFTLQDVAVGDTIEVRGYESPAGSGHILATRLERLPPSMQVEVRGPFTATTPPQFAIMGVVVDTTGAAFGSDNSHVSLTASDFFMQAVGRIVEVKGTLSGAIVTASEVTIESEEDR